VEAKNRIKSTGVSGAHVEKMMGDIERMSYFAEKRGDQFYLRPR
jgi:hypothetical protein